MSVLDDDVTPHITPKLNKGMPKQPPSGGLEPQIT
jgi:hypothetical protein